MSEGISKLQKGDYLYVGINSNVIDFMPMLRTMRSVTRTPIFIATSEENYTVEKQSFALTNGADMYARFQKTTSGNIEAVLSQIEYLTIKHRQQTITNVTISGNVILTNGGEVFITNKMVKLSRLESGVLRVLMENSGTVVTHEVLIKKVWGNSQITSNEFAWRTISRMRKKLLKISEFEYIKIVYNSGYKFVS